MKTRTDHLLDGRVQITQSTEGYRAGLDAVMLAAACPIAPGETLLDMGCGAGAASLCVAARVKNIHITGIEIQADQAELAQQNFTQNHLATEIIIADIKIHSFAPDYFDHIIINPPFHNDDEHTPPQHPARETAFMMDDLALWLGVARRTLKTQGSMTLIHRADSLAEIIQKMAGFGAIEIIAIHPKPNALARRVIIRARKGRKTPLQIYPPLVLATATGEATENAHYILRDGAKLL
jgi:tRNA1Val (adenine37-N6)-methyltransferase